jgi:hypothetical protein
MALDEWAMMREVDGGARQRPSQSPWAQMTRRPVVHPIELLGT